MRITPMDIHHKQFKTALRGYSEEEVDSFLDQVADQMEQLTQENTDLRNQIQEGQVKLSEYEKIEKALQNALVNAQKMADEVLNKAKNEAEQLRAGINQQVEAERAEAAAKIKRNLSESARERDAIIDSIERLKSLQNKYQSDLKGKMEQFLSDLVDMPQVVKEADMAGEADLTEKIAQYNTPEVEVQEIEETPEPVVEEEVMAVAVGDEPAVNGERISIESSPFFKDSNEMDIKPTLDLFSTDASQENEPPSETTSSRGRRFRKNKRRRGVDDSSDLDAEE